MASSRWRSHSLKGICCRYGVAIALTVIATWLRVLLQPWLGTRVPFGMYFASVLLTAWLVGPRPALFALGLGIFAAAHYVIPPENSLFVGDPADQLALLVYGVVGLAAIVLSHQATTRYRQLRMRIREVERLTAQLQDAGNRKDEFLALLAHELRNPLAPIRTGLELLSRESIGSEQQRAVRETMRRQLEQLVRIVDDLLDVSRFLRGQLRFDFQTVDLVSVAEQAIETVQPLIDAEEHDLRVIYPRQKAHVLGDRLRLVQVISNLLTNAAKYTPKRGRITLSIEGGEESVRLSVIDNGIGISHEAQSRIFDLFTQADPSSTRDKGGLGLGLAIVQHLARVHEGKVEVYSEGPGRGSRFTLTLPVATEPPTPESKDHDASRHSPVDPTGTRVLVVDDNQDAAESLAAILAFEGYATRIAADGPEAIQLFDEFHPAAVVLDIGLPGMDGYEVARCLRGRAGACQPTIIAVTGWGGSDDRERSREAKIDSHLVKPVEVEELMQCLADAGLACPLTAADQSSDRAVSVASPKG